MSDLARNNYARLKRQYLDLDTACRAARRIDNTNTLKKQKSLSFLLRHHDEQEKIKNGETWDRDEVDQLLHFYSIMEIAALLGLIPDPLPDDLRSMALRHLRQPAVNKYFVTNYPLVLPQLFLLRVTALLDLKEDSGSGSFSEFIQLLTLDGMIHGGDEDVDNFLWMLDGGSVGRYDIDDIVKTFKTPATFVGCLTKVRKHMTGCDSAVRGCFLFISFCRELDTFLDSTDVSPMLRYESWHLYGYWFSQLQFMVGDRITDIIDKIGDWEIRQDRTSRGDKKRFVTELRAVMNRLLSGVYGQLPGISGAKLAKTTVDRRDHAQIVKTIQIPIDRMVELFGPSGKIRGIAEQTGVKINVDDSGNVNLTSEDGSSVDKAIQIIKEVTPEPEVGKNYLGKVSKIVEFGAFVEIIPGIDGLLHISEIAEHRVKDVRDEMKEGDEVLVKVLGIEGNRIKISRKAILREQAEMTSAPRTVGASSLKTSKE
jgi:predicted RNA-binding protein with RPS1 domain